MLTSTPVANESMPTPALTQRQGTRVFRLESRVLDMCPEPVDVFQAVVGDKENAFLLESSVVREGFSRYSFIGDASGPYGEMLKYDLGTSVVTVATDEATTCSCVSNFFEFLSGRLSDRRLMEQPALPFQFDGGYVGYLCYELKAETSGSKAYVPQHPAAAFMFVCRFIAIDHVARETYLLHLIEIEDEGGGSKTRCKYTVLCRRG